MYPYEEDKAIKHIRRNYQIPDSVTLRLLDSDEWACSSSKNKVCFYKGTF